MMQFIFHAAFLPISSGGIQQNRCSHARKADYRAILIQAGKKGNSTQDKTLWVSCNFYMEALRVDMEALGGEFLVLKWMVGVIIVVEVLPHLKFLFA